MATNELLCVLHQNTETTVHGTVLQHSKQKPQSLFREDTKSIFGRFVSYLRRTH
jgi:hypothetical protein